MNNEQEINLKDLVIPLWKGKYKIIIISLLFPLFVLSYELIKFSFSLPIEYRQTIIFNFEGVEKGVYPNGSIFSPNDLLASNILKRVYDNLGLADKGIDYDKFTSAINIRPGFNGDDILKNTATEIAKQDKKIPIEDFNKIVNTYLANINAYALQSALLTLDDAKLGLGDQLAQNVLSAIPKTWAEYSIRELGVMNAFSENIFVRVSGNVSNEPVVMVSQLADFQNLLSAKVNQLRKNPRALSIKDKKSGLTLTDLSYKLGEIDKYQINVLRSIVMDNQIYSTDIGFFESFRKGQLEKLERERGEIKRIIAVYDDVSTQFDQSSTGLGTALTQDSSNKKLSDATIYSPQYGDGLVNSLLELGGKMADPAFKKELLNKKIELSTQLQKIETEIQIFTGNGNGNGNGAMEKSTIIEHINKSANELDNLADIMLDIVNQFNSYAYNNQGSLYTLNGANSVQSYSLNDSRIPLKLALAFVLGFMIACAAIWIRRLQK